MLRTGWRRWLTTRYLDSWHGQSAYCHVQILGDCTDNPDQRISQNLYSFTSVTLGFIVWAVGSATALVAGNTSKRMCSYSSAGSSLLNRRKTYCARDCRSFVEMGCIPHEPMADGKNRLR